MERPFERAAFARRLGGLAVPAQITVPFAADVVRKTGFAVLRRFEKPFQILFVLCIPVSHQAGDQDLVVGPPQLHVVLIRLRRQALAVDEVQQAAVFLVPARFDGKVEHVFGFFVQRRVARSVGLLHQEPAAFDVMPGVHHTSGGEVALELAIHAHTLQRAFHLRLVVIRKDVVDALGRIPVVQRGLLRVYAAHHAGHIQKDHRVRQCAARARLRNGFGAHSRGVRHAVVQVIHQLIRFARALQMFPLARLAVILRVADGVKAF